MRPQLLRDEAFEQRLVEDEHAVLAVAEQVATDSAAGLLVGLQRDESHAAVGRRDLVLRKAVADDRRIVLLPVGKAGPDAFLGRMIVGDGEGHDMLERHLAAPEGIEQLRAHTGELEPFLHDGFGHAEARRDVGCRHAAVGEGPERLELVGGMHRLAQRRSRRGRFRSRRLRPPSGCRRRARLRDVAVVGQRLEGEKPACVRR